VTGADVGAENVTGYGIEMVVAMSNHPRAKKVHLDIYVRSTENSISRCHLNSGQPLKFASPSLSSFESSDEYRAV
jgi:hypothetical protein